LFSYSPQRSDPKAGQGASSLHVGGGGGGGVAWLGRVAVLTGVGAPTMGVTVAFGAILVTVAVVVTFWLR
jgi:hypothetical protein